MLEVLRADEVVIRLAVDGLPTAGADDAAAGATPQSNTFFDVVVRVRNRLCAFSSSLSLSTAWSTSC